MATKSKYREMADEEAQRAEAEEPEDEDEDEAAAEAEDADAPAEPAEPAEPEGSLEPLSAEAFAAQLETVIQLHADNLAGLFGDRYAEMEACPLCQGLGATAPEAIVLDPTTMRCSHCRGWGQLLTEAQDDQHRFRQCPACFGNGYIDKIEIAPEPAPVPVVEVPPMPIYDAVQNRWITPEPTAPSYFPEAGAGVGGTG